MPKTYIFIQKYRKLEAKMHTKTKKEDKKNQQAFLLDGGCVWVLQRQEEQQRQVFLSFLLSF